MNSPVASQRAAWKSYRGIDRMKGALHCACGASTLTPRAEHWQWRRFTLKAGNPYFEARCGGCRSAMQPPTDVKGAA